MEGTCGICGHSMSQHGSGGCKKCGCTKTGGEVL